MLDQFTVTGTYDQIAARIKERWGGIVDRIAFAVPIRNQGDKERLKALIRELQAI